MTSSTILMPLYRVSSLEESTQDERRWQGMKKLVCFVFWAGVVAVAGIVALQFQPVREAVRKAGMDI